MNRSLRENEKTLQNGVKWRRRESNPRNVPAVAEGWIAKNDTGPCLRCGTSFTARKRARRFCSVGCAARHARTQRGYRRSPLSERFWKYVAPGSPDECWEWAGYRDHRGYGRLSAPGGGNDVLKAHRVCYEIHHGPIPDGLHVLHSCDNPPCCNPRHLRLGNAADNTRDRVSRGRGRTGGRYLHSAELVALVRQDLSAGASYAAIAEKHGVKERWVQGIALGERRTRPEAA